MQAARGTSLTGDQTDPVDSRPTRRSRHRLLAVYAAVALTAYAVDVVSKILAVDRLSGRPDLQLVGDLFQLHLVRNPGAAFSAGTEYTEVLSIVAIVAVLVLLFLARRIGSVGWAVSLGLLLAGVAGNLTDRLVRSPGPLRGHVIDFFMLPHWPVFNVADICIDVAAVLILVQVYRGIRLDGARAVREPTQPEPTQPEPTQPEAPQ
jgi:signal peptidase II